MSDYAGPILGVVGAIVGGAVTGWVNPAGYQWGFAIGSALGGAYSASQQVIPGPKIGDVQRQTSQEGGFRPIVYGRSTPISGNVIADSEPKIVKKKEDAPGGKGGPKVETEYAYRTYAVGFCEGEAGLLQAWRNGILVYDAEDPSMAPENAKFLEYARWYSGSFDQNADPDLEGIYGVGSTPFFRGTAYLVLANEDVTDQRGAWSQWQVRVFRGSARSYTTPPYSLFVNDGLTASIAPANSTMLRALWDSLAAPITPLDCDLTVVVNYLTYENYEPEPLTVSIQPLDSDLVVVIGYVTYGNYEPEPLTVSMQPLDSDLVVVAGYITYQNYDPEQLTVSMQPLDSDLTVV